MTPKKTINKPRRGFGRKEVVVGGDYKPTDIAKDFISIHRRRDDDKQITSCKKDVSFPPLSES